MQAAMSYALHCITVIRIVPLGISIIEVGPTKVNGLLFFSLASFNSLNSLSILMCNFSVEKDIALCGYWREKNIYIRGKYSLDLPSHGTI